MDALERVSAERPKLSLPLTTASIVERFGLRSRFTAYQVLTDTQHLLKVYGHAVVDIAASDIGQGTKIKDFENYDMGKLIAKLRASKPKLKWTKRTP